MEDADVHQQILLRGIRNTNSEEDREAKKSIGFMYAAVNGNVDVLASRAAVLRKKRLNKPKNNWILGILLDLLLAAAPWVVGMVALCVIILLMYDNLDGAAATFTQFNAPVAISAIATFASFLLVTKQGTNLGNNSKIIGEFGNLSGSLVNICLFVKSQISSGKKVEFLTLADGSGGFFQTTRMGLVCASVCYIVKYTGRGAKIVPEGLPLGQDARLLKSYVALTSPSNGSPGMGAFAACILMIGELVDEFQAGEKPSEYAVLFGQINAVTAAEGSIGGTTGYGPPYLMKWLLGILYTLYLFLVAATDLVPNNRWNSLWIGGILAFCTIAFYQISERYGNPMKLRSRRMGQAPLVTQTCVATEIAITSIFARASSTLIGGGGDTGLAAAGMRFTLA
jgi:hypothetical protein